MQLEMSFSEIVRQANSAPYGTLALQSNMLSCILEVCMCVRVLEIRCSSASMRVRLGACVSLRARTQSCVPLSL